MRKGVKPGLAALMCLAWVLGPGFALGGGLVVPGSGEPQLLLRALAPLAAKERPGLSVEIPESVGTGGGIKVLLEGKAVLARISRPLKDKESAAGLGQEIFAVCPVAFAANVPPEWRPGLSPQGILDVYQGRVTDWSGISSGRGKIHPLTREPGDSLVAAVDRGVPGFLTAPAPAAKTTYTTPETVALLVQHPNSLGYASLPAFKDSGLTILPLSGVLPGPDTLKAGTYPLDLPLGLVWKGEPTPEARAFMDFLRSPVARSVIRDHGCLPAGE